MLIHFKPNEFAFSSVLSSCPYEQGRQVHALALKMCVYVGNALITMYSKSHGCSSDGVNEAWTVFQTMDCRNLISWNSMIAGLHFRKLALQALDLFRQMHHDEIGFDRATLVSVLSSLCGSNDIDVYVGLKHCKQLHCLSFKTAFLLEIKVATALVKAYSDNGGDVADCYRLFMESSCSRDIVSWTGIITAFAERDPEEALYLFRQLSREDLAPDWCTFSIALKACAGFVTTRHAMAVHALVIKNGLETDTVIANALIHAYARCGSISLSGQLAKLAADKLKELDPDNSLGYVQISNIYCSGGSFNKAGLIRKEMKWSGVRKEPGLSWIEIGTQPRRFAS
ncbi:hypothetical protein HS088_TW23G00218 [Tripterygium wilfordii]|uniref:Pentatricopeptide repeat-containing protein n=1 Tax=Tripterygium wilfordii TaxID=458696 RepID=A0A7J7BVC4_TRIWF|nr:hypothetical protein HS088_TW23G00218 [Tripterygium wilfordii]